MSCCASSSQVTVPPWALISNECGQSWPRCTSLARVRRRLPERGSSTRCWESRHTRGSSAPRNFADSVPEGPIHTRDRLHEAVPSHGLVDIHGVHRRRIKTGQPYVANDYQFKFVVWILGAGFELPHCQFGSEMRLELRGIGRRASHDDLDLPLSVVVRMPLGTKGPCGPLPGPAQAVKARAALAGATGTNKNRALAYCRHSEPGWEPRTGGPGRSRCWRFFWRGAARRLFAPLQRQVAITPYRSPLANAVCERWIGSARL